MGTDTDRQTDRQTETDRDRQRQRDRYRATDGRICCMFTVYNKLRLAFSLQSTRVRQPVKPPRRSRIKIGSKQKRNSKQRKKLIAPKKFEILPKFDGNTVTQQGKWM